MSKKGVDVSTHNGVINWAKAKSEIDFAIIRAGYAHTYDAKALDSIKGCEENNIPYGLYWASYALTIADAKKEADMLCDLADSCNTSYPLCYDWEYFSDGYASKSGVTMSNTKREEFAKAFLSRVEERGYYAMLYTNIDYLSKGFANLVNKYDIWLAQWNVSSPSRPCGIWQKTNEEFVAGIGLCDYNITYKDYPYLISVMNKNKHEQGTLNENQLEQIKEKYWEKYMKIAKDVIADKYGVNPVRKSKLKALGYDYDLVQEIVNALV